MTHNLAKLLFTVNPVLSGHSKKKTKIGLKGQLSLNADKKHSAILLTFIKLPFINKFFVLSILSGLLRPYLLNFTLKITTDSRIRSIICKGPKYRFPVPLDFKSCREEIAGALQEFCNRWCKREHVESNALNSWKLNIFKIIDGRISFYCNNLDLLPPKPKFTFRHLKKGIQEFHRKFVLAPAYKAANNVVVV